MAGVDAYRAAVADLTPADLSMHYTTGLAFFHERFVPAVKARLNALCGGALDLEDFVGIAAGSDCDLITHVCEAVAARDAVRIFDGDWHGFRVGCTQQERIGFGADGRGVAMACLCIPSVRNGHLTEEMLSFLTGADACLLNLNLLPTLATEERRAAAQALAPVLGRSILSISFSRGFGLTASQLGVALVHRDHPLARRFAVQWAWHTYFYNAIAARAFMALDLGRLEEIDEQRRQWVAAWLSDRALPALPTGSYYVRAFRVDGPVPAHLAPLVRDGTVRLCFEPPQS